MSGRFEVMSGGYDGMNGKSKNEGQGIKLETEDKISKSCS